MHDRTMYVAPARVELLGTLFNCRLTIRCECEAPRVGRNDLAVVRAKIFRMRETRGVAKNIIRSSLPLEELKISRA